MLKEYERDVLYFCFSRQTELLPALEIIFPIYEYIGKIPEFTLMITSRYAGQSFRKLRALPFQTNFYEEEEDTTRTFKLYKSPNHITAFLLRQLAAYFVRQGKSTVVKRLT